MGRHYNPDQPAGYHITQMWDVHHEIVRLALIGMKQVDIAAHLGCTPVMVSYTLKSPIVKRQMDLLQAARNTDAVDVAKEIKAMAPKALEVLKGLMDSEMPNVRLKAATDVLDRAGHGAIKMVQTANVHAFLTAEELDAMKKNAREVGLLVDSVIDLPVSKAVGA